MANEKSEIAKAAEQMFGTYSVPPLEGIQGSIEFLGTHLRCFMQIDNGKVTLGPGDGPADTVVTSSIPEELLRLVQGKTNLVTQLLQGHIEVSGDLMLLTKVAGSMPELAQRAREHATVGGA